MKVTKPRLPSTRTTSKTRPAEIGEHRNFASKGENSTWLQDEVKATSVAECELLLGLWHEGES